MDKLCDWSELPPELLELSVRKLDFIDVPGFKGVCSSFRLAAKVRPSATPLLMHQSTADHGDDDEFHRKFGKTVRFLSPHDMNAVIYSPQRKRCLERLVDNGCCVGSSHGWLVVLDKEANPFLLNPFSGAEIELPKKETFLCWLDWIRDGRGKRDIEVVYDGRVPQMQYSVEVDDDVFVSIGVPAIKRAILTGNPSSADDYKVFIIFGDGPTWIAFWCPGDREWRPLTFSRAFHDVAFHRNKLYAIQFDLITTSIRKWDFSSAFEVPQNCLYDTHLFLGGARNNARFPNCLMNYYLVSSGEELFYVVRFIRSSSVPNTPLDHKTVGFEIYKVGGADERELVPVESLPCQTMFLGGNHGMVVSAQEYDKEFDTNSIYFTSDYVDTYLTSLNYEIGIYSLEDGSVKLLCDVQKEKPLPFWLFPGQK